MISHLKKAGTMSGSFVSSTLDGYILYSISILVITVLATFPIGGSGILLRAVLLSPSFAVILFMRSIRSLVSAVFSSADIRRERTDTGMPASAAVLSTRFLRRYVSTI